MLRRAYGCCGIAAALVCGLAVSAGGCGGTATELVPNAGGSGGSGGTGGIAGSGGTAGTSGGAGQGGSGGEVQRGDCDQDRLCPDNGSTCTEVVPGGFTVCAREIEAAMSCAGSGMDDCCDSSECVEGQCFAYPAVPAMACGGAQPPEMNVCASDFCASDADCQGIEQICVARGVFRNAIRYCALAKCRSHADCDEEPGGVCAPVREPCCGATAGLYCVYPSNGCRSSGDCAQGEYCEPDFTSGEATCVPGSPMCPA